VFIVPRVPRHGPIQRLAEASSSEVDMRAAPIIREQPALDIARHPLHRDELRLVPPPEDVLDGIVVVGRSLTEGVRAAAAAVRHDLGMGVVLPADGGVVLGRVVAVRGPRDEHLLVVERPHDYMLPVVLVVARDGPVVLLEVVPVEVGAPAVVAALAHVGLAVRELRLGAAVAVPGFEAVVQAARRVDGRRLIARVLVEIEDWLELLGAFRRVGVKRVEHVGRAAPEEGCEQAEVRESEKVHGRVSVEEYICLSYR